MEFKTIKTVTNFIKDLKTSRGYNPQSTIEWKRLSMKLSDVGLIQYARRLAHCLETDNGFLVGVDEQDFNPKIYVLDGTKFCVIAVYKQVNEEDQSVRYLLGFINDVSPNYQIDIEKEPLDDDVRYALSIITARSIDLKDSKQKNKGGDSGNPQPSRKYSK